MVSAIQGLSNGLTFLETRRQEGSIRAGENRAMTAFYQFILSLKAVQLVDGALLAATGRVLSWPMRAITYITPFFLSIARSCDLSDKARLVIHFVQSHIGTLHEIAALVSCVVLLHFGHTLFATTSLVVLVLGILDRKGWLPMHLRHLFHKYCQPLIIVTGLFGTGIDRIFALLNTASWVAQCYLARQDRQPETILNSENLDCQTARNFLRYDRSISVNREHILCAVSLPVPDIDIEMAIDQFDAIDWEPHMDVLREKCRRDARFSARHGDPDQKSDEQMVRIVGASLTHFLRSVKQQRIVEGEPLDYERLHNYLKVIVEHIEEDPDAICKADALMKLAIDGGEHCGPGKYEVAEELYSQVLSGSPSLSLDEKVLHCLQSERNRWMHAFYDHATKNNPIAHVFDRLDIHAYNTIVNCYGDRFGLQKSAAENDDIALIDPIVKIVLSTIFHRFFDRFFWADHNSDHLINTLSESIGTPQLPKPEVYDFWRSWIERQEISNQEKENLQSELVEGMLFNTPLEIDDQIHPRFIALMLFDMGILKRQTREERARGDDPVQGLLRA